MSEFKEGAYFVGSNYDDNTDYDNVRDTIQKKGAETVYFSEWYSDLKKTANSKYKTNVILYIVRHGVAYHNIKKYTTLWHGYHDTSLVRNKDNTFRDKDVIESIGSKIGDDMSTNELVIDKLYTSQLIRSQQTLFYLLKGIQGIRIPDKVFIFPCLNEKNCVK